MENSAKSFPNEVKSSADALHNPQGHSLSANIDSKDSREIMNQVASLGETSNPTVSGFTHPVRVKFSGTGLLQSSLLTPRGTIALVEESFMHKKIPDVISIWLDGARHPRIGTLGLPLSHSNHPPPPYTGKRLRTWQQLEPWNRERPNPENNATKRSTLDHVGSQQFWEWLESMSVVYPNDMRNLALLGGDYNVIGDLGPVQAHSGDPEAENAMEYSQALLPPPPPTASSIGSREWVGSLINDGTTSSLPGEKGAGESFFYQRLLASIILPDGQPHPLIDTTPAITSRVDLSDISLRKRTILELGSTGLLRDTDGDGNWLSVEDNASASDVDSEICRELRAAMRRLRREELSVNGMIAGLRRRLEAGEAMYGRPVNPAAEHQQNMTINKWAKAERKRFLALEQKFLASMKIDPE